jgi:hypothetical protein
MPESGGVSAVTELDSWQVTEMKDWYSAKLRFAVLIESKGLDGYMDSLLLFRADDFVGAFQRALDLGRRREVTYLNSEGHSVAWRLAEVVSLDVIRVESLDGAEVYSEPVVHQDPNVPMETDFHPELSQPTQTF